MQELKEDSYLARLVDIERKREQGVETERPPGYVLCGGVLPAEDFPLIEIEMTASDAADCTCCGLGPVDDGFADANGNHSDAF